MSAEQKTPIYENIESREQQDTPAKIENMLVFLSGIQTGNPKLEGLKNIIPHIKDHPEALSFIEGQIEAIYEQVQYIEQEGNRTAKQIHSNMRISLEIVQEKSEDPHNILSQIA